MKTFIDADAMQKTVQDWDAILQNYSCDESSDDEAARGMNHIDVTRVQKRARGIIERVAPFVPASSVPDDLRDAHAKALERHAPQKAKQMQPATQSESGSTQSMPRDVN